VGKILEATDSFRCLSSDGHAVRLAMCNNGELARQVFKDPASQVFFY
jgi:hypothetical protein